MIKIEFTFLGKNMEAISLFYGIFLIVWGLLVTFISESNSLTSLIPSLLGLPIFLLSVISIKSKINKKLLMHIVVIIGIIVFIGGLDFMRSLADYNNVFLNFWADISKLMMMITGFIFSLLCVKSFIFVRKNKNGSNKEFL
mgnify:CR=1 FL=1|tara:strand:- start:134 stop:556 length:423 start_codon:yes stop_codon:yes gene_type:complete